jgi:branched-chain amino acid transport system ATP-binding protein
MQLTLNHIHFGFLTKRLILNNLSVTLHSSMIYALMGSNGAGKTTLFNIITGFIRPKTGKIFYNKKDLTRLAPSQINRQGIGRTFQHLRLITKITVRQNIILAMQHNATDSWYRAIRKWNKLQQLLQRNIF